MFSLLRLGRRGRSDSSSRQSHSPYPTDVDRSRSRPARQSIDDDGDLDDGLDQSLTYARKPMPSYFDRHDRQRVINHEEQDAVEDEDGVDDEDEEDAPLLPIFSSAHLDLLPLYNVTHSIRLLIIQKCETTLSWDQLRSPQISQFLVKPIQNEIRTNHFNRATLCALVANCLQFQREGQLHPANIGVSKTRALICELLAMRLIKEYTSRELIDALSYDFDPLQGMSPPVTANGPASAAALLDLQARRAQARGARVSTIEIAIRAQAKRFLAHAIVVQHLEAIWAGTIVFHSEADNLHRRQTGPAAKRQTGYGTIAQQSTAVSPAAQVFSKKGLPQTQTDSLTQSVVARRSVTLYNPKDASLFKLSRLRVPRYRQILTTFSFATMLALFIAVLVERSLTISPLEVLFWFWSAGYMLDEVVGFTEQGFGLYILSFWNAFDLGILLLFFMYYCLRLYGIVLAEAGKQRIADMAYDVLASTAVLLFPRMFSVLDHYRYFSQLLIAFRLMAQDLMAILVLILISCSGFFVAFTLSFSDENTTGGNIAYALFQILMGFTPAAWDKWQSYNMLGQALMAIFLIICHFLIVTILITVLTNSFMAVVRNADEEHQFVFAVNTISMVKSDALFSYIAPTNVIGWVLSPLRYLVSFRRYVKFNRYIIKLAHFPVLFAIFAYERLVLANFFYEPAELLEKEVMPKRKPVAFSRAQDVFSPGTRLREPSVVSFSKDRALEEVFRRPFRGSTRRTTTRGMAVDRRNSTSVVNHWMQVADEEGGASPPLEEPRSVLEQLEHKRPVFARSKTADRLRMVASRDFSTATRSVASDPDVVSRAAPRRPQRIEEESEHDLEEGPELVPQETDADGDDENNEESDAATPALGESALSINIERSDDAGESDDEDDFYQTPMAGKSPLMRLSRAAQLRMQGSHEQHDSASSVPPERASPKQKPHVRQTSKGTILFAPNATYKSSASGQQINAYRQGARTPLAPLPKSTLGVGRTTRSKPISQPKTRPAVPTRQQTAPNVMSMSGLHFLDLPGVRKPSLNARALDLASEIGDNKWGPSGAMDVGGMAGMSASFSEQLLRERDFERRREEDRRRSEEEEKGMVNRIMLARMNTLEEGFREVLREIKDMSQTYGGSSRRESEPDSSLARTPIVRLAGGHEKGRRSPKKRRSKGKEAQVILGSKGQTAPAQHAYSPDSVRSVIDLSKEGQDSRPNDGRPTTALNTGKE